MITDKQLQNDEAPAESKAEPAESKAEPSRADGQRTKSKRDWVEWGKTAQKSSEDFMPGRIEDSPPD